MLRAAILGFAVLALALSGCGRQPAAPSQASGDLATYVMDAQASPTQQAPDCGKGKGAYDALVVLVSSDTGTSVQDIAAKLRSGSTLNDVAGTHQAEVRQQATALVDGWLRFAVANDRLTQRQAVAYAAAASHVIDVLMAADVSACVPAGGQP